MLKWLYKCAAFFLALFCERAIIYILDFKFMRISYSAFDTYQNCSLKYKFANIDKIKEPKSKEAVFGTLVHGTMKFIHTPSLLPPKLEDALDYFSAIGTAIFLKMSWKNAAPFPWAFP